MRSSELDSSEYDSDKIVNHYLESYDPILEPFLQRKIASLMLWHGYFPLATIVGIDIDLPKTLTPHRACAHQSRQPSRASLLTSVASDPAFGGFGIVIDDASHRGELTSISFWHLVENHLKPGGPCVIEHWGTGHCDDWPHGKSLDIDEHLTKPWMARSLWSRIASRLRLRPRKKASWSFPS